MNEAPNFLKGILWGLVAFVTWGFVPIYWKYLHHVSFMEVLGHRIIWASFFLGAYLTFKNQLRDIYPLIIIKKNLIILLISTALIFFNWNLFIWAVDQSYIVECSLGYFITPLINVLLGVFILKEKLKPYQWLAVSLATMGIAFLLLKGVGKPSISIGLALTFGLYGLLKKKMAVGSIQSLFFETTIILLPALGYFAYLKSINAFSFLNTDALTVLMLIGSGPVTLIPLVAFGFAVRNLPLTTVGIMQYIAPTLQLLGGVLLFNEAFTINHFYSFSFIWMGLLVYTIGGLINRRGKNAASLST